MRRLFTNRFDPEKERLELPFADVLVGGGVSPPSSGFRIDIH
jgi:hypothetical protein